MKQASTGSWAISAAGCLLTLFFLWFGFRMLLFDAELSDATLVVLGVISILSGVFVLTTPSKGKIYASLGLILAGFYFLERANGNFRPGVMSNLLGLASIAAGGVIYYFTLPTTRRKRRVGSDESPKDLSPV